MQIRRALVSVHDKTGIVDFVRALQGFDIEILSTGGTAKLLRENGLNVVEVSSYTGFPEIMDGRVKTLHPKIHGGILAVRDNNTHKQEAEKQGIKFIDLVVVNLYPFQETIAKPNVTLEDAIENIDIGGPSMVRAAAKNYKYVTVVTSPSDYDSVIRKMKEEGCSLPIEFRQELATKTFRHTAVYDSAVANYLGSVGDSSHSSFPDTLTITYQMSRMLRYGENPHQRGAFYISTDNIDSSVARAKVLGGKELSYNNILDLDSAYRLAKEFDRPLAVIVKHNNPCGVGWADGVEKAFVKALAGDPVSAYGGVLAFNVTVDVATAEKVADKGNFFEAIIAPAYEAGALDILTKKPKWGKNLRILEAGLKKERRYSGYELRSVESGLLVQTADDKLFEAMKTMTVEPTESQRRDLIFGWKVAKHTKSNAIVLAKDEMVVGVGAGQMSRLDSVKIAVEKAGKMANGSVLASDAFFPFKDGVEEAIKAGVSAIIQPGGSIRDDEVIETARKHNVPMIFTGMRHFKH